ncbi:MAG: zinc ABC transporter substrate-binding protein [Chitinivibrionales bacterium]|nr:zinc ABC transporter substrate-binding protein [Chitinivibrionales bacterium]
MVKSSIVFVVIAVSYTVLMAQLKVITSIPDIADIATHIGGEKVSVFSLAQGSEDVHLIRARSSFLPKLNRADMVLSLGLAAEERWLPNIVNASRNDRIKKGNPGWIEVYTGLDILEKPQDTTQLTDTRITHRQGNPHYNSGPYTGKIIAENIFRAFSAADGKNSPYYKVNLENYVASITAKEHELLAKAALLKGVHVISYHADLAYFCNFYGMTVTGCIEPKPGLPPNPGHIAELIEKGHDEKVMLVLYHQAQNPRLPEKVAAQIGAQTVCFANMVKSRPSINSFIDLQEFNLNLMLDALKKKKS